ncbi:TRAPP trafficking subunit Trs65-domain-containing protein [Bombardia bombarda]|uniref:TRAPP trafficking subunit Trs65-domain-containing protein n=1 Tax=Bombardia bombarda TaxID=252184 RepID=A0AA39WN97_9PEZI|nr:TRAPP trafficking subunit Trs65-domain-containing protein [Bombardia bombarda]
MAFSDRDDGREDAGQAFLERSYLSYIVPFASNFQPETALKLKLHSGGTWKGKFSGVEQRELLFFDETAHVYLVLRTPPADEQTLRSLLRRLAITLEAQIVNTHAPDRESPPATETIFKGTVEDIEDAIILTEEPETSSQEEREDEEGEGRESEEEKRYVQAVWKLPVFLGRPRIRLQAPTIVFSASASLKISDDSDQAGGPSNGYMESCLPSGLNLLESFADDPMLGGVKPQLSAVRVSRVAPVTQINGPPRLLKGLQKLRMKIYPAVHPRVRFSRPNTTPPSPALIALLEVDFTPFFDCEIVLNKIALKVTDGTVEDLNTQDGMGLPLSCVAHDHLTFIYRLAPQQLDVTTKSRARDLDIAIEATALVSSEGPNICLPRLTLNWTTNLDFTLPVNPGFGQPMTQPIQRSHRPSQLSIGGAGDVQSLVSPSVSRPDALPSLEASTARTTETTIQDFGITMTFTGPDQPIYAGEEFSWSVFVVNRSRQDGLHPESTGPDNTPGAGAAAAGGGGGTSALRKLALVAVPKRRRNELRVVRPPSTAGPGSKREPLIADAVLDENVVHAVQRSSLVGSTELVCLSADVRVGPLAPDTCAVVELRFLALKEGIVGIEAVRIIDLGTQEHVDVRELPMVVVQSRG